MKTDSPGKDKIAKRLRTGAALAALDREEHGELLRAMRRVRERLALDRATG